MHLRYWNSLLASVIRLPLNLWDDQVLQEHVVLVVLLGGTCGTSGTRGTPGTDSGDSLLASVIPATKLMCCACCKVATSCAEFAHKKPPYYYEGSTGCHQLIIPQINILH